jgi:hypothetical protein
MTLGVNYKIPTRSSNFLGKSSMVYNIGKDSSIFHLEHTTIEKIGTCKLNEAYSTLGEYDE